MSTVSQREWLDRTTGQAEEDKRKEDLRQAAEDPGKGRQVKRPDRSRRDLRRSPHAGPDRLDGAQGDVPAYPEPLPGAQPHIRHEDHALPAQSPPLDVGPAGPAYGGMMAHGVPAPVEHGGRPAPRAGGEATALMANRVPEKQHASRPPAPVPVYLVPDGAGARPLKRIAIHSTAVPGPSTVAAPVQPAQVCGKDPKRTTVRLMNETPAAGQGVVTVTGTAATTAAGGGVGGLGAFPGSSLTGFIVTFPTAATVAGTVTVTNVLNGPLVYNVPVGSFGLTVVYPEPIPEAGGTPVVTVSAIAGTGNGNVVVTGQTVTTTGGVAMRVLTDPVNTAPGSSEGALLPAGMTSYQDFETQDELFVIVDPAATPPATPPYLSVILEYAVPNGA